MLCVAAGTAVAEDVGIAILGDSLVAGYGLKAEEGLVPQLQGWLDDKGVAVRLINAGVSGDTTAGGLARLDWTLGPEVDALVVSLGANDFLRGLPPEAARENLEGIVSRATDKSLPVMIIGFRSPANWGPDYKTAFDDIYPELAERYETIFMPFFFEPLASDGATSSLLSLLQPDGLHPNEAGVAKLVEVIGPYVVDLAARIEAE